MYKKELLDKLDEVCQEMNELEKPHCFYKPLLDKDGFLKDITIDRLKLLELLKENGFYRYDLGLNSYCFVQTINKKVKQVSITYITDWWFSYLDNLPAFAYPSSKRNEEGDIIETIVANSFIQNKFLKSINSYFSENMMYRLIPEKPIKFNTDTKTQKYIYYKNGYVLITKQGYDFITDYSSLAHHVWENQILNRNFNPDQYANFNACEFYKFCYNISGQNSQRMYALQTIIGYTLHHYREYKLKATILTDAQLSLDGEANGRTGKGIFVNGLGFMLNNKDNEDARIYCQINGKGFDFNEKHRYQKADINTKLIHLEDVKAYFLIDNMFNDITEGVEVDKKNEKPFIIHPKFVISTNKTIKINGGSAKDRVIQFEFAEYYSKEYSPENEFGHWLFTEWRNEQWELFDCFMVNCIYKFFKNNLKVVEPEPINLLRRSLIDHTSQEFVNYMDYYKFKDYDHSKGTLRGTYIVPFGELEKEYVKRDLYNDFTNAYPHFLKRKGFSQSKFTVWLRAYAENSNLLCSIDASRDERRSNGLDLLVFRRQQL